MTPLERIAKACHELAMAVDPAFAGAPPWERLPWGKKLSWELFVETASERTVDEWRLDEPGIRACALLAWLTWPPPPPGLDGGAGEIERVKNELVRLYGGGRRVQ